MCAEAWHLEFQYFLKNKEFAARSLSTKLWASPASADCMSENQILLACIKALRSKKKEREHILFKATMRQIDKICAIAAAAAMAAATVAAATTTTMERRRDVTR